MYGGMTPYRSRVTPGHGRASTCSNTASGIAPIPGSDRVAVVRDYSPGRIPTAGWYGGVRGDVAYSRYVVRGHGRDDGRPSGLGDRVIVGLAPGITSCGAIVRVMDSLTRKRRAVVGDGRTQRSGDGPNRPVPGSGKAGMAGSGGCNDADSGNPLADDPVRVMSEARFPASASFVSDPREGETV